LVDTIPPSVQKLPLDGSTGSRSPRLLAATSSVDHSTPGSAHTVCADSSILPR